MAESTTGTNETAGVKYLRSWEGGSLTPSYKGPNGPYGPLSINILLLETPYSLTRQAFVGKLT
jgi:hypothetical protein